MPESIYSHAPAKRGGGRYIALAILFAFVLGAAGMGMLAWSGYIPLRSDGAKPLTAAGTVTAPSPSPSAPAPVIPANAVARQDALDARMAAIEARLAEVDLKTAAASGTSARAEGLLIAFAARRAIERGAPLGFLEDQLRLRFADAQPGAVNRLIEAGRKPVTLGDLTARLDSIAPSISATPAADLGTWQKVRNELANLFVIRRESTPSPAPANRLDRARAALEAGRVDEAVAEVQRLPGAADADGWIADARRYGAVRDALDLIETTALLETRALKDGTGQAVVQPSPAGSPAE